MSGFPELAVGRGLAAISSDVSRARPCTCRPRGPPGPPHGVPQPLEPGSVSTLLPSCPSAVGTRGHPWSSPPAPSCFSLMSNASTELFLSVTVLANSEREFPSISEITRVSQRLTWICGLTVYDIGFLMSFGSASMISFHSFNIFFFKLFNVCD